MTGALAAGAAGASFAIPGGALVGGGIALLSGIANLFEGSAARKEQEERLKRAREALISSFISNEELGMMLNNTERLFNNRLVGALNTTALRSRGYANREVVGAAVTGTMEGEKIQAISTLQEKAMQYNKGVQKDIASLELQKGDSGSGWGDFFTGMIGGTSTAIEAGKFFTPDQTLNNLKPLDLFEEMSSSSQTVIPGAQETYWDYLNRQKNKMRGPLE